VVAHPDNPPHVIQYLSLSWDGKQFFVESTEEHLKLNQEDASHASLYCLGRAWSIQNSLRSFRPSPMRNAVKGIECAFCGVLSTTPELKQGKAGKAYANFSCVVAGEAGESWLNVITFNENAEELVKVARKGDSVYVHGSLSLATWQNADGEARSGLAVSAWKAEKLGMHRPEPRGKSPSGNQCPSGRGRAGRG
jgi:hypothetical protein